MRYEEWDSNRQQLYNETLKAGEKTISKTLAKLNTAYQKDKYPWHGRMLRW